MPMDRLDFAAARQATTGRRRDRRRPGPKVRRGRQSDGRAVNDHDPCRIIRSPINVGPKWDWKDNRFVHMDELDPPMRGVGRALTTRSRVNACQPGLFTEYLLLSILQ
jgi:hypothetical protein